MMLGMFVVSVSVSVLLVAQGGSATAKAAPDPKPRDPKGAAQSSDSGTTAAAQGDAKPAVPESVFRDGVVAFEDGKLHLAAALMWHYIHGNAQTADHYEWAELFLAKSLLGVGLSHGSVEYLYNVAKDRKRPELLPEALALLEKIRDERPYDEELVELDLLAGADFGALPPANKSYVEYQQGHVDLIEGRTAWAARHFVRLTMTGDDDARVQRYVGRARLATVVADMRETSAKDTKAKLEKRASATKALEEIVGDQTIALEVKNDARRVLAQVYFEESRFEEALTTFETIAAPFLSEEEANLFLEKAWARFYKGDPRGTLGILLTLDAPSYRKYFKPERFVLKALALKQLCHYASAKAAAREFLRRYGASLAEVRRSRDPLTDPVIRTAAVQRKKPRRMYAFLDSLQRERDQVDRFSDEHGLAKHLARIYELKIAEANRELDRVVRDEANSVAAELLDYEEQARLVDYEVSLEVFRRVKKGAGRKIAVDDEPPIPLGSRDVYYKFNGEYWNDELHDYRFRIDNRCFGEELLQ